MTELTYEVRPARGAPEGALVLLHGRGADQYDLQPVIDALDPEQRLAGVTPRGPLSLPPGGAHWYALGGIPTPEPETFHATYAKLAALLDRMPEITGVPWERTVLGGFSQGTAMSYALGLGAGRPSPAGILAMSGFVPSVPGFALDLDSRAGLPVAIAHGSYDPVIGVEFGRQAAAQLEGAGLDVHYREGPVAHGIDPRSIPELRDWLAATLAEGARTGAG
jgi:phospholipase/carboxylesterase